ncbi:MAG: TetR/AcrR family transcriptional regulator [Candidatus Rokubacteria bacterium]|nr:TetR/AcrR family transcriptional regulator [Candidatus Rokubacteria bacterium]
MRKRKAAQRGGTHLTRERILAVSGRVFNQRGYHGTTLDDIARALGVTKAALYYHVKNKEELLFQCHQLALDIGMEGFHLALAQPGPPDEQLRAALAHYIEGMADQLKGTVVLLEQGALSPPHHRRIVRGRDEYEQALRRMIAAGITAGVFVPCDPKLVGFAILGAVHWIPKWYHPAGPSPAREIAEAFATYLVRGLTKQPSPELPAPLRAGAESAPLDDHSA